MEYVLGNLNVLKFGSGKFFNPGRFLIRHIHDHFIPHPRNNYHPHILGHRLMGLFSMLLVTIKIFTLAVLSFGPVLPALSSAITPANIINLTNESRKIFNLPALVESEDLTKAAQAKADDMLKEGYFAHASPDGRVPWDFIQKAGYDYLSAGENLAVNFIEAENVETAWMNSPTHKANIVNKNFEEIGIGIAQGEYQGHQAIFVVQMFGTPAEQKMRLSEEPTPVLTETVPKPEIIKDLSKRLEIKDTQIITNKENIQISAKVEGDPVKVMAVFGEKSVMFEPKSDSTWKTNVKLESLLAGNEQLKIQASDITGKNQDIQVADFSGNTVKNFHVLGASTKEIAVNFFGKIFNPKQVEQKFYLWFAVLVMVCMILAIGIHRRVQHVGVLANSSFVVILAMLFWLGG